MPEAFGHMSLHCRFSDLGPFRLRIFSRTRGERTRAHGDESNHYKSACQVLWKANQLPHGLLHCGRYTLSFVHDSPVTETCVKRGWTVARAPFVSYCSTEGVAPLHTAPPVPVTALPVPVTAPPVPVTAPPVPVTAPPVPVTMHHQCRWLRHQCRWLRHQCR